MEFKTRVLCIGAGYVGGPTMAVIADRCPHVKVSVTDINRDRIDAWNSDNASDLRTWAGRHRRADAREKPVLHRPTSPAEIRAADIIFVSVNTPTKAFGEGAGRAADLQHWETTARDILTHADRRQNHRREIDACPCVPPKRWPES